MPLYQVPIRILSPVSTPLKGDTIWGHVVWGIALHEGENKVTEFLAGCRDGSSPFAVSSAFPHGYVCRPLPRIRERKPFLSPNEYAQIKANKKNRYVPVTSFFTGMQQPVKESLTGSNGFKPVERMRNSVNRISGTVEDNMLFPVSDQWPSACNAEYDLYVFTNMTAGRVRELFIWAFENGYGADASTGNGRIELVGTIQQVQLKYPDSPTYLALAPFVRTQNGDIPDDTITDIRADIFVRTGKIGGMFAGGVLQPYKKTVVLFDEGAVVTAKTGVPYIGRLLTDIHSDRRICQSGFAPVIPFQEEETDVETTI
jgi:CRISPR-associated protein Csm4